MLILFTADKLEVTSMQGQLGEDIPLFMRVQSVPKATKWLRSVDNIVKNTMAIVLQKCIQARMDEGTSHFREIIYKIIVQSLEI